MAPTLKDGRPIFDPDTLTSGQCAFLFVADSMQHLLDDHRETTEDGTHALHILAEAMQRIDQGDDEEEAWSLFTWLFNDEGMWARMQAEARIQ